MNLIKSLLPRTSRPLIIIATVPLICACPMHASIGLQPELQFTSLRQRALQTTDFRSTRSLNTQTLLTRLSRAQVASMLEYSLCQAAWGDGAAFGKTLLMRLGKP